MKKGLRMTESKLYPGSMQFEPMKYCSKASEEQARTAWESGEWIAQEKKDGALYQLEKTDEGQLYLFSRTKSKKTGELAEKLDNFPQIRSFGESLPYGTILIGEVYVPGGKSNDTTRLTGCLSAKAIARQFDEVKADVFLGPAHYYIFDIVRYAGELLIDKPTIERLKYLEGLKATVQNCDYIEVAKVYEDNFEEHLQKIFAAGGEGMVFKHKNCPYRVGKRSTVSQMFKWKQHLDSVDLVCMELLDPEPYYTGKELDTWPYWGYRRYVDGYVEKGYWKYVPYKQLGYPEENLGWDIVPLTKHFWFDWKNAMRLGAYKDGELIEVGRVASGLTDELREDMADNPDKYLGKVIEVECMSTTTDGTLRHPVFIRVRDDKAPQDCKWEEIFN